MTNYLVITLLVVFSILILLIAFGVMPREAAKAEYESSQPYIEGRADMDKLRSLAPDGCKEGMHAANTCEILGYLEYLDNRLLEMEERLKND